MIIWIVGLSGAGKSTIGREVYSALKARRSNTVLLDGDEIRQVLELNKLVNPYAVQNRRKIAWLYHKMCVWLDRNQINVICCTISNFQDILDENRANYSNYLEIYVEVPITELVRRDRKGLYRRAFRGEITDVVGVDIPFVPPRSPDMVIDNTADKAGMASYREVVSEILRLAGDSVA